MSPSSPSGRHARAAELADVLRSFLVLGCIAFGGPLAHVAWFRREFVDRRQWLDGRAYAELVALCQVLPGPSSSQVGMAIGLQRAGLAGAIAAWLGFTLPSALMMLALGASVPLWSGPGGVPAGALHGLKLVAVAVIAQALWSMGRQYCRDAPRLALAALAAVLVTLQPGVAAQIGACAAGAAFGALALRAPTGLPQAPLAGDLSVAAGSRLLALFALLLCVLPVAAHAWPDLRALAFVDAFYRAGALVFGGGHVVLPMLQSAVVAPGWIDPQKFLEGYGAAQALPGPLFSFAGFLGAAARGSPSGWAGGLLALAAMFLPGFLLITGCLPLWQRVRGHDGVQRAIQGVNAAVVGLLLGAWLGWVWPGAVHGGQDMLLVAAGFLLLVHWELPPWLLVALALAAGRWLPV